MTEETSCSQLLLTHSTGLHAWRGNKQQKMERIVTPKLSAHKQTLSSPFHGTERQIEQN